ncbi:molybdenum cofactor biosysynthesis protein [Paractinoplanes durhamensis]|uniref:Molybdenum cofactor biosysynthesis protein n=2 Tax=Paractinoplanes durhamensis TaxID=113563 RepID=A0ABQ3Z220_9ACTN|nr:molybdenum cofactor biosysynthesis protein [Actinoplanes durhamensis]
MLSVNVGVPRANPAKKLAMTGIDKRPVDHPVQVRRPGPKTTGLHSGLVGDPIGDIKSHGGDDQAVYAYAREDYDWWEKQLDRQLAGGAFGENLTTLGIDVNGAMIGEVWRVGEELELQPTFGRIPCATFQARMAEPKWLKRFTKENRTGAYLRIVTPGFVQTGDPITVVHRPDKSVSIAEAFQVYMLEPARLARLLDAEALPDGMRAEVERRIS